MTLKNTRSGGGLLHSHPHLYPEGSGARQQQVTCYSHKDANNHWYINPAAGPVDPNGPVKFVHHGDIVRLQHVLTRRNLHSHKEEAPITRGHYQVTAYGNDGEGDANDLWRVEIISGGHEAQQLGDNGRPRVQVLTTLFRLIHVGVGCALHSHGKQLPKWGYEQLEVTCNPSVSDADNTWNVERHENARFADYDTASFYDDLAPSLFWSTVELHAAMREVNEGFKPKENEVVSRPWQWPIDYRGQRFSGWTDDVPRVYLIGNPVLFFANLAVTALFVVYVAIDAVLTKRRCCPELLGEIRERKRLMLRASAWLLLAWALHYVPFWFMGRVLYFHHYFPALLFHCMFTAVVADYFFAWLGRCLRRASITAVLIWASIAVLMGTFIWLAPVAYGMTGPVDAATARYQWLPTWDI